MAFGFILNCYFCHQNVMVIINRSNILDQTLDINIKNTCVDVKHINILESFNGSIFFIYNINIAHWNLYWFLMRFVMHISQWVKYVHYPSFLIWIQLMVIYGNKHRYWWKESILGWKVELAWIHRSLHNENNQLLQKWWFCQHCHKNQITTQLHL